MTTVGDFVADVPFAVLAYLSGAWGRQSLLKLSSFVYVVRIPSIASLA